MASHSTEKTYHSFSSISLIHKDVKGAGERMWGRMWKWERKT